MKIRTSHEPNKGCLGRDEDSLHVLLVVVVALTYHVRINRPIRAALYKLRNWFTPVVMTCSATLSPGITAANGTDRKK